MEHSVFYNYLNFTLREKLHLIHPVSNRPLKSPSQTSYTPAVKAGIIIVYAFSATSPPPRWPATPM